jgi:hypothetical protein
MVRVLDEVRWRCALFAHGSEAEMDPWRVERRRWPCDPCDNMDGERRAMDVGRRLKECQWT